MQSIFIVLSILFLANLQGKGQKKEDVISDKDFYQFEILRSGAITPQGWIKKQLKRDLNQGYIGHYDDVHHTVNHEVFKNQNRISRRRFSLRKEWWSGEHEGYWKDAVIRMAFLTNDSAYKTQAARWIDDLIEHAGKDGYIGIYEDCDEPGCRFQHERGNGELWATSRILMAMLAYYEFTGNDEVLQAAEKAANLILHHYKNENYFGIKGRGGGVSHGIGFFENLEWLYRLTGKQQYLKFAVKLYEDFNNSDVRDDDLQTQKLLDEQEHFDKHGAHIAEGLFVPEFIANIHKTDMLDSAAHNVLEKLQYHTTPGGAMRCDEWIKGRKGTADEHYEYCGIAEMVSPLNKMISFTGDLALADRIEKMTFNAGQGARFPVLKGVSYLTTDNRIKIRHRELAKRESYDAAHFAAACCALNAGRLMPYYVEGMWMKDAKQNGLLAALYGPSKLRTTIDGQKVEIVEKTNYPFADEVKFEVNPSSPVTFSLILRKPFHCQDIEWNIPEEAKVTETKDRIIIQHAWQKGDEVSVKFNFMIQKKSQPKSKTVKDKGMYLQRGPLVFALPFDTKIKTVKEYRNSGFYRYKIKATDKDNWKLKLNPEKKMEFIPAAEEKIRTPWDSPVVKLKVSLENKHNETGKYYLVPMGNTILRRVTFTLTEKNKNQ